ncbi:hypothetical protein MKW98_018240 [Papaver atlanticum]|uniref:Uncharacterized protein n=1 Tax=Papaver atlanticum TaxID=357466 RepID=A0AAD4S4T1_9MAGN|nr:hypothetical protein MKW98_018240 [Papaver atlanticum]
MELYKNTDMRRSQVIVVEEILVLSVVAGLAHLGRNSAPRISTQRIFVHNDSIANYTRDVDIPLGDVVKYILGKEPLASLAVLPN